ncbi:MAG TPA: hypothetical protein VGT40_17580 [Methylomirabilota bacterium]|jgi:hypothetical protein|nr:hypothetical protein [Methylomirabilota bacterium]
MPRHPDYLADFDSGTGMLRALAAHLKGEGVPLLGAMPRSRAPLMVPLASAVNWLPKSLQEQVYIWSGWLEATSPKKLGAVSGDEVAAWMTSLYPRRPYPAVAVGSSNGAAVHLWAALGIPWLPQTFLVPVARSGVHPDEPEQDIRWAAPHAETVLRANPDLQLHHMHDPVQDRLMIQRMSYFRLKRRTLGADYERFLRDCLEPGGTIVVVECGLAWPTTRYGDRHIFQFGALGGATVDELMRGGERVEEYLRRHRSHRTRWEPPAPDGVSPEAEWGFAPSLRADVEAFAQRHGYRIRRVVFEEPEHVSPLVADLYRWWYAQLGIGGERLVVDSFILMEPYWTIRTGSVPFWMVFNKEPSFEALDRYLATSPAFAELFITLFSHGVDSIGLVPISEWRRLFQRAARGGDFIGVDEQEFPRDFAVFVRYHFDFLRKIAARHPIPSSLTLTDLDEFLARTGGRYRVRWIG